MRYPGYLLNPGDMFQVESERVMFATGAPKLNEAAKTGADNEDAEEAAPELAKDEPVNGAAEAEDTRDPREVLKNLRAQAKAILSTSRRDIGAKRKQDLRAFSSSIKRLLSKSTSATIMTDSLEAQLLEIQNQLNKNRENKEAGTTSLPSGDNATSSTEGETSETSEAKTSEAPSRTETATLTDSDYNDLHRALQSMQENPVDDTKPYATPWMPKDYMSAFAFIPRFLEVNHSICAAVYLRHPVARPGLAEVPSPYPYDMQSTAFTWYLRRR
jgi:ribosomal protein S4